MVFLFLKAYLSGTSVRPDHVAVFVFFSTVLNDGNCTMNHEILKKKLRPKKSRGGMRKFHIKKTTTTANWSRSLTSFPIS